MTKEQPTAADLREALWTTLQDVSRGKVDPRVGEGVARCSREFLRVIQVQIQVCQMASKPAPEALVTFATEAAPDAA
jgi:hypothetical protein